MLIIILNFRILLSKILNFVQIAVCLHAFYIGPFLDLLIPSLVFPQFLFSVTASEGLCYTLFDEIALTLIGLNDP